MSDVGVRADIASTRADVAFPKGDIRGGRFPSLAQQPVNPVIGFLDKGLPVAMSANEWSERRHQLALRCPLG